MISQAEFDPRERAEDLLISRALGTLDRDEEIELDALLDLDPSLDDDHYELVAASLDLALDGQEASVPADLRAKLEHDSAVYFGVRNQAGPKVVPLRPRATSRRDGWVWQGLAVAAVLVLMVWIGTSVRPGASNVDGNQLYDRVVAAADLVRWDWAGTEDPAVQPAEVSGDVVWSSDAQQGVMKIGGLAANDPGASQYQLWIFDRTRDERFPVDGGVFDVPAGAEEIFVPIQAKLDVDTPYLFAITVEEPGGVVVSSRERIAFVAQPPEEG